MKKILIYLMGVACVALAMSIILLIVNLCIPYAPISMEIFFTGAFIIWRLYSNSLNGT